MSKNFSYTFKVNAPASLTYMLINNVSRWWTENLEGSSASTGDEFVVRFGDVHYSKQKLTEMNPGEKIVWLVTESRLNFLEDREEWNNTEIVFEIEEGRGGTTIRFTHKGLVPGIECYDVCSSVWTDYLEHSLKNFINTGKGKPEPLENLES